MGPKRKCKDKELRIGTSKRGKYWFRSRKVPQGRIVAPRGGGGDFGKILYRGGRGGKVIAWRNVTQQGRGVIIKRR